MGDGGVFAALPSDVVAGGGVTDEVGKLVTGLSRDYEAASGFDPNNPPWGEGDATAKSFEALYVPAHADLRDTLRSLADAITSAADLTINSGRNFHTAQVDAVNAINTSNGGGGGN